MNDRSPPPSASPADDAGLEELRALYHELPVPPPSDALRKRLQSLTQVPLQGQAASQTPQPGANSTAAPPIVAARRRWRIPAALAASIAASITVGLLVYLQNPPAPTQSLARTDVDAGLSMQKKADSSAALRTESPRPAAAPASPPAADEPAAPISPALPASPPAKTAGNMQSDAASAAPPAAVDRLAGGALGKAQTELKSKRAPAPFEQNAATSAESAAAAPAAAAADSGVSAPTPAAGFPDTADGWYAEIRRREAAGDHAGAVELFERFRKRYPDDARARQFPAGRP